MLTELNITEWVSDIQILTFNPSLIANINWMRNLSKKYFILPKIIVKQEYLKYKYFRPTKASWEGTTWCFVPFY